MEDLKVIFAQNLIALRKQMKLTQIELAEKINYSDKAVSKWERGESIPDVSVLLLLSGSGNTDAANQDIRGGKDGKTARESEFDPISQAVNLPQKVKEITGNGKGFHRRSALTVPDAKTGTLQ